MSAVETAVKRPIGVTMILSIFLLFGFIAFRKLPIDLMPDITYPMLIISTSYSNAGPEEIETLITRPIEQAVAAISGVEEIDAASSEGRSNVRLSFTWGTDIDEAANEVRDKIDRVIGRLPDDVDRPMIRKFDSDASPVIVLGVYGDLDTRELLELVEQRIQYRFERIPGVAAVEAAGGDVREIHVALDIDKMRAMKIAPDSVISRIRSENMDAPAGNVELGIYEFRLRTLGEFDNLEEIANLAVAEKGSNIIRLKDIATVKDTWRKRQRFLRIDGKPGITIMINKQSGSNTVAVAEAVKKEMEQFNQEIPQLNITTVVDSSLFIKRAIENVTSSALMGGLLAVIILQVFLMNWRMTLIIAISIPASVIITFALMYFYGFTLNIMSLGGLALGVGMLVDNSIVVLENIFRYRGMGHDKINASVKGTNEVIMALIASTLTTVVVFLPLVFTEGMTGVMFKQLAWVIGFSLLCSMVMAVFIVPMLSSLLLATQGDEKTRGEKFAEKFHALITGIQGKIFSLFFNNKVLVFAVLGVLAGFSIFAGITVNKELMPTADEGEVNITIEAEDGTILPVLEKMAYQAEAIARESVPEAEIIFADGGKGRRMTNASIRIPLVEEKERSRSSDEIANDLRRKLQNIPGATIRTRGARGMFRVRGSSGGDNLELVVRGYDIETANALAEEVKNLLETIDGITDARLSRDKGVRERSIIIDRDKAADQRLTVSRISSFLETLIGGRTAGYLREDGNEYAIILKAENAESLSLENILNMLVMGSGGNPVVLKNAAYIKETLGPTSIQRRDQERIITVTANIAERAVGDVIKDVQERLHDLPLPPNFSVIISGDYEEQQKSYRDLAISFLLAVFLVFMVMAVQYESLIDPLIVMTTVPLSLIGGILFMYLTKTSFNVQAFIGFIMLAGIVVNNSIVLVDHINDLRRENKDGKRNLSEIVQEASKNRTRPILMTTLTTILGLVPLAISSGEGGEMQAAMAVVVIGGLSFATLISLFVIPIIYHELYKNRPYKAGELENA